MTNSKKAIALMLTVTLLVGLGIGVGGYFLVSRLTNQKPEVIEQEEEEEKNGTRVVEVSLLSNPFKGEYIEASLPDGWSIKEYEDGANFDDDLKGSFKGLTSVVIFDENTNKLLSVDAIPQGGYGILEYCSEVFKFQDSDPNYFDEQYRENLEYAKNLGVDESEIKTIDLSEEEYFDIEFLDLRVRRIGTDLYYFSKNGQIPLCDIMPLFSHYGLEYTVDEQRTGWYSQNLYQLRIEPDASKGSLILLDKVLESMKVVRKSMTEPDAISMEAENLGIYWGMGGDDPRDKLEISYKIKEGRLFMSAYTLTHVDPATGEELVPPDEFSQEYDLSDILANKISELSKYKVLKVLPNTDGWFSVFYASDKNLEEAWYLYDAGDSQCLKLDGVEKIEDWEGTDRLNVVIDGKKTILILDEILEN
jgi:hypothetical protein